MKPSFRKTCTVLLSAVLVVSGSIAVYRTVEQKQAEKSYSEAETLVELPDPEAFLPAVEADPVTPPAQDEVVDAPTVPEEETPVPEKPVYMDPSGLDPDPQHQGFLSVGTGRR